MISLLGDVRQLLSSVASFESAPPDVFFVIDVGGDDGVVAEVIAELVATALVDVPIP